MTDLGLDRPVHEQYGYFVLGALKGDLGRSFVFGEPALRLIVQRMPATLELAFMALLMAVVLFLPNGILGGLERLVPKRWRSS